MTAAGTGRPARRARDPGWLSWVACLALAAGLHALWLWAADEPLHLPSAGAAEPPTRLAYAGAAPSAGLAATAEPVWSPVLFALPTDVGFSSRRAAGAQPGWTALQNAPAPEVLLARAEPPRAEPVRPLRSLAATVASSGMRLDTPDAEPVFPRVGQTTGFTLRVWWPDGEPDLRGGGGASPRELAAWLDERPWEAQALITFDRLGSAAAVLLERGTPSRERNEAIVRGLHKLRAAPSGEERTVRVVLQYEQETLPAPRGPPSAAEARP